MLQIYMLVVLRPLVLQIVHQVLYVTGISTFDGLIDANGGVSARIFQFRI